MKDTKRDIQTHKPKINFQETKKDYSIQNTL